MSTILPHTRAWLALVSGQVPQLTQHLQPLTDFLGDNTRVQAAANASMASVGTHSTDLHHLHAEPIAASHELYMYVCELRASYLWQLTALCAQLCVAC